MAERELQVPRTTATMPVAHMAQIFAINPRRLVSVSVLGSVTFYAYNLEVVPVSGRRRFNIVSQETEAELAKQMFVIPLCSAVGCNC